MQPFHQVPLGSQGDVALQVLRRPQPAADDVFRVVYFVLCELAHYASRFTPGVLYNRVCFRVCSIRCFGQISVAGYEAGEQEAWSRRQETGGGGQEGREQVVGIELGSAWLRWLSVGADGSTVCRLYDHHSFPVIQTVMDTNSYCCLYYFRRPSCRIGAQR